jgi:branched-chain amino acid transport system permease protein
VQQAIIGRVVLDPESLRMLMFGLALILVMLWRPAGLWPSTQRRREFAAEDSVLQQEQETVYDAGK